MTVSVFAVLRAAEPEVQGGAVRPVKPASEVFAGGVGEPDREPVCARIQRQRAAGGVLTWDARRDTN